MSQIPDPLHIINSKRPLNVQISQGLGPFLQTELLKTGRSRDDMQCTWHRICRTACSRTGSHLERSGRHAVRCGGSSRRPPIGARHCTDVALCHFGRGGHGARRGALAVRGGRTRARCGWGFNGWHFCRIKCLLSDSLIKWL